MQTQKILQLFDFSSLLISAVHVFSPVYELFHQLLCADQFSIGFLLEITSLNKLGDHVANFGSFERTSNVLLEPSHGSWLAFQIPGTDVAKQPVDPANTLVSWNYTSGTEIRLSCRNLGNSGAPSNVLEGDLCLPKPLPGRTNSSEPHSGLDRAREERIERRVLIDPIIDCVSKIEILLLCRFVRPWQLRYLLRNEASDVDELSVPYQW
jgi:hypothetical protein